MLARYTGKSTSKLTKGVIYIIKDDYVRVFDSYKYAESGFDSATYQAKVGVAIEVYSRKYDTIIDTVYYDRLSEFFDNWVIGESVARTHKVITLCGDHKKYNDYFMRAARELTRQKYIVLSNIFFLELDTGVVKDLYSTEVQKERINMSDAIFVIDPNGSYGDINVQQDIIYANENRKQIFYMHDHLDFIIKENEWED